MRMKITCMPAHVSLEVGGLGVQLPAPSMLAGKHLVLFLRRTPWRVRLLTLIFTARWANRPLFEVPQAGNFMSCFFLPSRGRILGRNPDKSLKSFLLAIHSNVYSFALRFIFLLTQPLTVSTAQLLYTIKEKGGKPIENHTPFPMI